MAFILVLKQTDRAALAAIRLFPSLEVATEGTDIWLKLPLSNDGLDPKIRQLPLISTFIVDDKQLLYPIGGLTPVSRLQPMRWQPLTAFMPIELPVSIFPAASVSAISVEVVPSGKEREAAALSTSATAWLAYVSTASEVRLKRLKFAVSDDTKVFIMGTPLPPIEGETYWLHNNIFMPSGFDFALPIVSELIFQKEKLDNQAFLCFNTEGAYHRLEVLDFVLATRSAVRLSLNKFHLPPFSDER